MCWKGEVAWAAFCYVGVRWTVALFLSSAAVWHTAVLVEDDV